MSDTKSDEKFINQDGSLKENATPEVFKSKSFMSICWSLVIFVLNLYTQLTSFYWACTGSMPQNGLLTFTSIVEMVMISEIIIRALSKAFNLQGHSAQNFLHTRKSDGFWSFFWAMLGSFPWVIIYMGILNHGNDKYGPFSRLLLMKLIRGFELNRTIGKLEEILFYRKFKTLILVKFTKNFIYILLVTHVATCCFLFVQGMDVKSYTRTGMDPKNPFYNSKAILNFNKL